MLMKFCIKCELEKDESEFSDKLNRCKTCISDYQKQYRLKNIEKSKKYLKEYYQQNRNEILEKSKIRTIENAEKISEYKSKHYLENKEKISEYFKSWYSEHKDDLKEQSRQYKNVNRDRINKRRNERNKERRSELSKINRKRRQSDPVFRISNNIRTYLRNFLKRKEYTKKSKTEMILGCSFVEFRLYLESKFDDWMSWENYGKYNGSEKYGWDIDHIVPISTAVNESDVYRLNHFTNLQPLCSFINRDIKINKLDYKSN